MSANKFFASIDAMVSLILYITPCIINNIDMIIFCLSQLH